MKMKTKKISFWLGKYFEEYLIKQRRTSRHTIHSYRDTWKLLLQFCVGKTGKPFDRLSIEDVDADTVNGFIASLCETRKNRKSTCNVRLSAIRAFFRWLAMADPQYISLATRITYIPSIKSVTREVRYLEKDELSLLLSCIGTQTPKEKRDYALLSILYNTGARVQEILNLRVCDVDYDAPYLVKIMGKGSKERICVIWPETAKWLKELVRLRNLPLHSQDYLFINRNGQPLTRHGVGYLLRKLRQQASMTMPSLQEKPLHPHILRHTSAMHMLQAGLDIDTIQNILGHSHKQTTGRYAKANLAMKRAALEKCDPVAERELPAWKNAPDILSYLNSL